MKLRSYQDKAISDTKEKLRAGSRAVMIQLATGGGKTPIAAHIIKSALSKEKRVLFIAHRRELIEQCADKLEAFGIDDYGIIMNGFWGDRAAPVQVASIQTLIRREYPPADLIIIDEAHRAAARTYGSVIANYPSAVVLGLSATPQRLDGRGLGDMFDSMVQVQTIKELIAGGYLVPYECYAGMCADVDDIKMERGDYAQSELEKRSNTNALVCDIVTEWQKRASDRQTIVFSTGIEHAHHIADEFKVAGVKAAAVSNKSPKKERAAVVSDMRSHQLQVMVNCGLWIEGLDLPSLSCCILARRTKSLTIFLQAVGRISRTYGGKANALVLDHAGCCIEHGLPQSDRQWSLNGRDKNQKKPDVIVCAECKKIFESCPKMWLGIDGKEPLDISPCCGVAKCVECGEVFKPQITDKELGGVDDGYGDAGVDGCTEGGIGLTLRVCSCPSCGAEYTDQIPHGEGAERKQIGTEDGKMVLLDEATLEPVRILKEYKILMKLSRERGYKRGFVWHQLTLKFSVEALNQTLPRHTKEWWRSRA